MTRESYKVIPLLRMFRIAGIVATVAIVNTFAYRAWTSDNIIKLREQWQQEQKYGTLLNPRYAIKQDIDRILLENLNLETLKEIQTIESIFNPSLVEVQAALSQLEQLEHHRSMYPESLEAARLLVAEVKSTSSPHSDELVQKILRPMYRCLDDIARFEAFHPNCLGSGVGYEAGARITAAQHAEFDIEAVALGLARFMTHKNFPATLKLLKEEQSENVLGHHRVRGEVISYRGNGEQSEIETVLHEAGHVAAQHQEQDMSSFPNDRRALEEASAYGFSDAGLKLMLCTPYSDYGISGNIDMMSMREIAMNLKIIFEISMASWIERYLAGNDDENRHGEGAVYFVATRNVMGNAGHTFNTLATVPGSTLKHTIYPVKHEVAEITWTRATVKECQERLTTLSNEWSSILYFLRERRKEFGEQNLAVELDLANTIDEKEQYFREVQRR